MQLLEVARPMGLATLILLKWPVPWDLPFLILENWAVHGTGHLYIVEVASPMGLAIPYNFPFQPLHHY